MIDNLLPIQPDQARSQKVVARCHARLARYRQREEQRSPAAFERTLVGGFALVYMMAIGGQIWWAFARY